MQLTKNGAIMKKIIYSIALLGSVLCTSLAQGQVVLEALEGGYSFSPSSKCLELVHDRNYGDGIHDFIYCAVQGPNGKKWLNLNLGAEYANIHSPHFNPEAEPTDVHDSKAFGNLFHYLRKADGHELVQYVNPADIGITDNFWYVQTPPLSDSKINYPNPTSSTPVNHVSNYSWTDSPLARSYWLDDTPFNPCPSGYRVVSSADIKDFFTPPQSIFYHDNGNDHGTTIIKNIEYPNLNLVTSPSLNKRRAIVNNTLSITSAFIQNNLNANFMGTSGLWVVNDRDGSYDFFWGYYPGEQSLVSYSDDPVDVDMFDHGYFDTHLPTAKYAIYFNMFGGDFNLNGARFAIRCVEN